jgi:pimeloyl-ACP methyl ester carboxylesterase
MGDDQIKNYFFFEYDPSGGSVALALQKQRIRQTFAAIPPSDLIIGCMAIDKFVRNEKNYNLQVRNPFAPSSNKISSEGLSLARSFWNDMPQSTPERDRLKAFMSYYFKCLVDNRPFSTNDNASQYLQAFRDATQDVNQDPNFTALRIVCSFSLLIDMVMSIAYTSGMTHDHIVITLNDMHLEANRLKNQITDLAVEPGFDNVPDELRRVLVQLADDHSDFPMGAYMYYLDQREDKPGGGLDGLMSDQIEVFNQRIMQRDISLMQLTYTNDSPGHIRHGFPYRFCEKRFWCLGREIELCDGLKVIPSIEMIIVFRGSWSVRDWITNFSAFPTVPYAISDPQNPAQVHRGFYTTLEEHWNQISPFMAALSASTGTAVANWKFRVVGHSLGASWARLAALKISNMPQMERPIHKIHLTMAAYPGVFFRAQPADAKVETMIVRSFYLKHDIVVAGGSLVMLRDLPSFDVWPRSLYLAVASHFIFNIADVMALTGEDAPTYHYHAESLLQRSDK